MKNGLYTAVKERRSIYGINDEKVISDKKIEEIVNLIVEHTPTAFNSQTGRIVVLLGEQHKKFWALVFETAKKGLAEEKDCLDSGETKRLRCWLRNCVIF